MLNTITQGTGAPLMIAHGLYGSARNWGVISKRLSDVFEVTAVDMRNHAQSPWFETHSYPDLAGDLAATLSQRSHVLGHSMGEAYDGVPLEVYGHEPVIAPMSIVFPDAG